MLSRPLSIGLTALAQVKAQICPWPYSSSYTLLSHPPRRTLSTMLSPDVKRTLDFWFGPDQGRDQTPQIKWFQPEDPPAFDQECRHELGALVSQARSGQLDHWTQEPASTIALVILLDQIPRNIFRQTAESFSSDTQAFDISTRAVAQGFDRQLPPLQAAFFYLPFEHQENIVSQIACLALLENLRDNRCEEGSPARTFADRAVQAAVQHRDVILRFGRFPARNKALGRQSTAEEEAFLKEKPRGF